MKKTYVISDAYDFVFSLRTESGMNISMGECFGRDGQGQETAKKVVNALNIVENLPSKKELDRFAVDYIMKNDNWAVDTLVKAIHERITNGN